MDESEWCGLRATRAVLVVGLVLACFGGVVVAVGWDHSWATVVAGSLLAGAGQFLVMLTLVAGGDLLDPSS